MDVMSNLVEMGPLIRSGSYDIVLKKIHELWDAIPEPKVETSNAYQVIEYGVACSMKVGDLDEAQNWAALAPAFAQKRQDRGEVEFLIGKVAFERGDLQSAKANFITADLKSKGRIFEDEDVKYRKLIN